MSADRKLKQLNQIGEAMQFALSYLIMPVDIEAQIAKNKVMAAIPVWRMLRREWIKENERGLESGCVK